MEKVMKLKANLERFFFEKAVDYGINPDDMGSELRQIDYQKLYEAIENQKRPLRGYTGFVAHKWRHDCSYLGEYYPKATLLLRVLRRDEEAALAKKREKFRYTDPCTRHYMELWIDRDMQLKAVSCIQTETPDDYYDADYITQYRKVEGTNWPDDHGEINLEELMGTLFSKANRISEYNQVPLFIPLRGEEGLMYELYKVMDACMQS